jgi:type IV pilus assembly protein PilB
MRGVFSPTEHLIKWAGLDEKQIAQVKNEQLKSKLGFVQAAVKSQVISEGQYRDYVCEVQGLPAVDPANMHISEKVLHLIEKNLMRQYKLVPFYVQNNKLYLACFEPDNIPVLDDVRFMTGLEPEVHVATLKSVNTVLDRLSGPDEHLEELQDVLSEISEEELELAEEEEEIDDKTATLEAASQAPVVKMVNLIIMDAIRKKASDIHIEPYEKDFRVRFRIDGVLNEVMRPPIRLKNALISRLKIMARLNIAEKRLPQDGRIKVRTPAGKKVEFRVSILPTLFGEKVVMRLLDKSALKVNMTQLGLEPESLARIKEAINKPYGMFLVTGPTGSGKTTTLYSAIMDLNKDGVNISTVEDPVEFSIKGVNQVQVIEEVGLTFAAALRSFLRQDPDIILVGEIRDLETAEIAIKAALTGHLVLSTLHTNDAPSTLTRLLDMGVDNFLIASSVNAIVAQRLLRKLCPQCKRRAEKDVDMLLKMGMHEEEVEQVDIYEPVGCDECHHSGYKGRTGVCEVLTVTPEMQELILKGATVLEIKNLAIEQGMMTMRQSGLKKLAQGIVSVQEVLRATV